MKWYDYLRADRASKISRLHALQSGTIQFELRVNGVVQPNAVEDDIAELSQNIAEIEGILTEAGEPID